MPPRPLLAKVEFTHRNGLPKDSVVNDFVFDDVDDEVVTTGPLGLTALLAAFYNTDYTGGPNTYSLGKVMGRSLSRSAGGVHVKYYDLTGHLDGTPTGSPVATDTFTLVGAGPSQLDMPAEVAVCLTIRGTGWDGAAVNVPGGVAGPAGDSRPRQRKSGRLYLGPLNGIWSKADGNGRMYIDADFRSILSQAALGLAHAGAAAAAPKIWQQWSRKDAQLNEVVAFQIDDAFDTQRRRGEANTVRTLYVV